jgi:hypothetical protein
MRVRNLLFTRFSHSRWFWPARRTLYYVLLLFARSLFLIRTKGIAEYETSKSFRALIPVTVPQLLLAVGSAASLQIINGHLIDAYRILGWVELDKGVYGTLFATVASIGAVFIGLYYTAITSVASSVFAKTPGAVRDLLASERIGNVYIRFLAFITCFSISLLALRLLNYSEILIAVPIVALLACIGILAFVRLGQRVFSFFDPVQLSEYFFSQLYEALQLVTSDRSYSFEPAFQRFAHRRASDAIKTLEDLVILCQAQPHLQDAPLRLLTSSICHFLRYYQHAKRTIPSKSLWYKQESKFQDVYRQNDTTVQMAHRTGTLTSSETHSNEWWVEVRLQRLLNSILSVSLSSDRIDAFVNSLSMIEQVLGEMAHLGNASKAVDLYADLVQSTLEYLVIPKSDKGAVSREKQDSIAISEALASISISILLQFRLYALDVSQKDWSTELEKIDWSNRDSVYAMGAPQIALQILEDLRDRICFEIEAEGKRVTPMWYMRELVFRQLSVKLVEDINTIYSKPLVGPIGILLEKLDEVNAPLERATLLTTLLEYVSKLTVHCQVFENAYMVLSETKHIVGLQWKKFDPESARLSTEEAAIEITKNCSRLSCRLLAHERDDSIPDFAGHFLHATGEAVYAAIAGNQPKQLKELIGLYFIGCFLMFNKLRPDPEIPEFRVMPAIRIALAPLADLMDLTGYAKLFSELYGDPSIWTTVETIWNRHLNENPGEAEKSIKIIETVFTFDDLPMEQPHRSLLRMDWMMQAHRTFEKYLNIDFTNFRYERSRVNINHSSPLIKVYAKDASVSGFSGIDIFRDLYFSRYLKSEQKQPWKNLRLKIQEEMAEDGEE